MLDYFIKKINEIYNIILQPIDSMYKFTAINRYKKDLNMGNERTFGSIYSELLGGDKSRGIVYTPEEISNYIIKNTVKEKDILENPYIKILDPACGCGNFIIPLFSYLREIYIKNGDNMPSISGNVNKHIIDNNIIGFDTDELAVKILSIDLFIKARYINTSIIKNEDFLFCEHKEVYDIILGNPPYIGHKSVNKDYSASLKVKYSDIYKDKGDISYCFISKSINVLKKRGKLTFITSRYFLESVSGEELRKVLKNYCCLLKIVDFYGIRPFKGVGIDPVIVFISNETFSDYSVEVIKPEKVNRNNFYNSVFMNSGSYFKTFNINKNNLNNKGWILRDEKERRIINKIEEKSFTSLNNICESFQGIISGCDRAFVVSSKEIEDNKLETDIIRPWIKSSYIQKNNVILGDKHIIYSNLISDTEEYPNCMKYISQYKEKLIKRRECVKGMREWFQLQWGREYHIFRGEKIVFPYKSNSNRFALDKGSFFSADVYCLKLKENVPFNYDYLISVLNSDVYEYYFKTFGKKLGEDIYEYYPNTIMKLCIPTMIPYKYGESDWLYSFFELDDEEIDIIKNA